MGEGKQGRGTKRGDDGKSWEQQTGRCTRWCCYRTTRAGVRSTVTLRFTRWQNQIL